MTQKPMRGAILGFGFISGGGHAPAYLERKDVAIVAVADICEARRKIASQKMPGVRVYADAFELIAKEELDFVDISTPPCDHAALAHAAFDRGMHVLCEKPVTLTVKECREVLEHATRARRVFYPCHNYKHAPVVKAIREIIDSGRIGKVRSLTLATYRNTHAKGVTEWHTHWRRERKYSGGGIMMDHGSHSFYLTFDWLGAYPTAVTAKMSILDEKYQDPKFSTEDNASVVLTFPGGKLAHAHLTWTAGMRKVIYTVQGERGGIRVDNDDLELSVMESTTGPDVAQGAVRWVEEKRSIASHWMDASHVSWFNSLFDEFRSAIERGEYVGPAARDAYMCIQVIEQSYRSSLERGVEQPILSDL